MDTSGVQFVGAPCGRHAQNTFYKAFKYFQDGKYKILTLGEFFYMKITRLSPICVGEIQMIYSNKQQEDCQVMTSVRAYFLPEHTPEGRKENHGEDELFAFSEKFILKAEDLVTLLEDGVKWLWGQRLFHEDELDGEVTEEEFDQRMTIRDYGMNLADVDKEKELIGYKKSDLSTHLTILSYPQYCRYRAVMRRLENVTDKWLKNAVVCAIGGIISKSNDNRIMFCRDTFYDADLEDLDINCEHLAPNLKGRRRKKKSITGDTGESDSNDASEYSVPSCSREKTGKRESALRNGFRLEKMHVSKEEQQFLIDLHNFMKKRNTPIGRIPSLGFKQIDLYMFYSHGMKIGGYEQITQKRMWKHLYDILGGNPGSTSAATCTRRHYEKLLLPYERHVKGDHGNKSIPLKSKKTKITGRPLGRPLGRPPKDKCNKLTEENSWTKEESKSEDKFLKRIKRRERFKLKLQEKALKWEELRVQKAKDRDKIKKVGSNPRTVKNILNSAMAQKSKSEVDIKEEIKSEKEENITDNADKKSENHKDVTCVKSEPSEALTSPSKHVANQSKLFKPPNDVQLSSTSSAKTEEKNIISPRGLPQSPMFYPHPFVQLGSMHPLGLPIIHQLPMAMQQYLQPSLPAAKQITRPNFLGSSPASSKSTLSAGTPHQHDKMAAHTLYQQPAHSNNNHSNISGRSSQIPGKMPITPPAHSNHKRSHDSVFSPNFNIPSQKNSSRSLLFDFETPKRVKTENDLSVKQSARSKSAMEDEQPQDLSMRTLCKKSDSSADSSVLDLRQQSATPSNKDNSTKSKKSEMTLNLPKHSMANILKTPNYSKRSSPNSVFNKSPVFNSANSTSSNSSTKGEMSRTTPPSSQSSVISPVHPAFPTHFLRSPIPQPGMFPSPSHLQQLYEAQIRATQVAAFEEMMQRDHSLYQRMPFPMFMPQVPLPMSSSKDKNSYAHAK